MQARMHDRGGGPFYTLVNNRHGLRATIQRDEALCHAPHAAKRVGVVGAELDFRERQCQWR